MFSKTCEYAFRAMIFIAQQSKDGNRVGVKAIAGAIDSPEHFIAKILQQLAKEGLLQSVKGPNGGFYLEATARQCSLADIVKAIDGDKIFTGCGLGLKRCSETHPCPIHEQFASVRKKVQLMLENAKLSAFTGNLEKRLTFLKR